MYIYTMLFEWDERKRISNLQKHGLDFIDVASVFEAPHIEAPSAYLGKEQRFLVTGTIDGRYVTIIYTIRRKAIRIISFRRARREERQKYQELYGGGA